MIGIVAMKFISDRYLLPAHCESPCGVEEPGRISGEGTGDRKQNSQLAKCLNRTKHKNADDDKGDDEGSGTSS